jgi:hypothetical protein
VRASSALAGVIALLLLGGCGGDDAGKVVEGGSFEVTVPSGWDDDSEKGDEVEYEGFTPDVLLTGDRDDGFTTNVNVIRTENAGLGLDGQVRAEREVLEAGRLPGSNAEPRPVEGLTPVERISVAGNPARAYEFEVEQEGKTLGLRQVIVLHDGGSYAITLTAAPGRLDEERDALDSILASWRWR